MFWVPYIVVGPSGKILGRIDLLSLPAGAELCACQRILSDSCRFGRPSKSVWPGWCRLYVWKCEECPAWVCIIGLETFGVVPVMLWSENVEKSWKIQFYCCSRIIYSIWIQWKCVEFSARVDKIGLGSFWLLPMELWSKNGQKHQKRNFTVILALFLKFEFHHNVRKIQPESIKLVRGHLQVFWWSYGPKCPKNAKNVILP